ncbi:MAG: hypothetical protein QXY21_02660 [Candidatus Micrarchaeaceae archaeon]
MYHSFITLAVPALFSFVITFAGIKFFSKYMKECYVTAIDHNKPNSPVLPSGLGIAAVFGFGIGILAYIFGASFNLYTPIASQAYLFATIVAVLFISIVGFIDDINVRTKMIKTTDMMDTRKGLKQWQKPLLTIVGAIPLIAINAGVSAVHLPFIGMVDFGIFYPLIIVPLAVMFGANAFNLLGGFDGIATGTGMIAAFGLLAYSIIYGSYTGSLLLAAFIGTLLPLLLFNLYPAKIIPGDSFTYFAGSTLIIIMILGNMESFGIIVFMPWIIEFLLHARKKFKSSDLGKLQKDGTMKAPYGKKIYSWTHIAMNIRPSKEWQVSAFMWCVELLFIGFGFALKLLNLL